MHVRRLRAKGTRLDWGGAGRAQNRLDRAHGTCQACLSAERRDELQADRHSIRTQPTGQRTRRLSGQIERVGEVGPRGGVLISRWQARSMSQAVQGVVGVSNRS